MAIHIYLSDEPEYSHLVEQWHPTKNLPTHKPQFLKSGSPAEVWWLCEKGEKHEWKASILSRAKGKNGCPVCSGRKIIVGENDLATTHPELAAQWHPTKNGEITPEETSFGASLKAFWVCPVGEDHVWETSVNSRARGTGCPYCANRLVLAGFNDLASSIEHAAIVKEWNPANTIDPTTVGRASNKKVSWICALGHEWDAIVANRTTKGSGCPECRKSAKPVKKETVAESPLAALWHPENSKLPSEVTTGSAYNARWVCEINDKHVWNTPVSNQIRSTGCPVCSGRKVITGVNDLASMPEYKSIVEEWSKENESHPTNVSPGMDTIVHWICSANQNHKWQATIYSRTKGGSGCPECVGRTARTEIKRKVSDFPELMKQWVSTNVEDPTLIPFRSRKEATWQCPKNSLHIWKASVDSRNLDGTDCPVCAGRVVIEGINDFKSKPCWNVLKNEWHPDNTIPPEELSESSNKLVLWQCKNDSTHTWTTPLWHRSIRAIGNCPHCNFSKGTSQPERDIKEILSKMGIIAESNVRNVIRSGLELDIYIPSQKFAIEYNGLRWHSEIYKDKNDHALKLQMCKEQGITLYVIWEDDWRNKQDVIIRGLANRLGANDKVREILPHLPESWTQKVMARKTTPKKVNNATAKEFFDLHHIQGYAAGSNRVALIGPDGSPVAMMLLKRLGEGKSYSISRYASVGSVPGGFTKLLAYAEKEIDVEEWVTFADLSISNGALYENNGFALNKVLRPDYSYHVKNQREHKFNYRIERFSSNPELKYEEGKTERELAELNGLKRIWDYGKNRYVKKVER